MREAFVIERELPDGTVEKVPVVRAEVFRRWRHRATAAFVLLALSSALGIALAEHANSSANTNLRTEAQRAVVRSCVDRMDVRLAVTVALDTIRRLAVPPGQTETERDRVQAYLDRTQPALDLLLTEAAGRDVQTRGAVDEHELQGVRNLGTARCRAAGLRFGRGAEPND